MNADRKEKYDQLKQDVYGLEAHSGLQLMISDAFPAYLGSAECVQVKARVTTPNSMPPSIIEDCQKTHDAECLSFWRLIPPEPGIGDLSS